MKIGILGSGNMGRSLGMRWAEKGHDVFFGSRSPDKAQAVADFVGHGARAGLLDEAAASGDVLLHTARGASFSDMLSNKGVLNGKAVIDLNNWPIHAGLTFDPITESHAEMLQADAPDAHIVKAFNMFAQELFEQDAATITAHRVSLLMAGDDAGAKAIVGDLGAELGFMPIDAGPLRNARLIETMGDMIRYLIIGAELGPFATLSVQTLPSTDSERLGGRQAGSLDNSDAS
ncbi:MAG: NAD(P)-binding domain-containing protein [Methyloceanibacter sp.]|nr:NAD(P)-binding domain-containing protein [Methyloceanibacter sp.]